jgi:hypothetical protein
MSSRVTLDEVKTIADYEAVREDFRRRVIETRDRRRVALGDRISICFENHETVLFQIQEMVRAERITDPEKVRYEVDVYNELVPDRSTLSATLLIEITERERLREELDRFQGLDREGRLYLQVGEERIPAQFEPGHSSEDRISAVHYLRFPLSERARRDFLEGKVPVRLVVEHPGYQHASELSSETRLALSEDLLGA